MLDLPWLQPGVFVGSIAFALIGVLLFWLCFIIVDKLTPYDLWGEIVERRNVALAIVVAAMCLSIGMIVAAAIHG
jgi:putative membrane protein